MKDGILEISDCIHLFLQLLKRLYVAKNLIYIEKAAKEYFWAQIVHEDIDVRTGVTEILQGILDNFPIEKIIYNMQEIKKS